MWWWLAGTALAIEPLPDDEAFGESLLVEPAPPPVVAPAPAVAQSKPAEDLLSPEPTEKAANSLPALAWAPLAAEFGGLWPLGVAGLGAGLFLVARRRKSPQLAELRVVSRTAVNGQSALLLVDVRDPLGRDHRLLIGTGGGPPALVADLGTDDDEDEDLLPASRPAATREARQTYLSSEMNEMDTLPNLFDHEPRASRKAQAQALISEVVEQRRTAMVRP